MSGDERESPRAAIRNWLHGTATKSPTSGHHRSNVRKDQHHQSSKPRQRSSRHRSKEEYVGLQRAATSKTPGIDQRRDQHRRDPVASVGDCEHGNDKSAASKSNDLRTHKQFENHVLQRSDEAGLAEKLGLHAPFRNFKDRSEGDDIDLGASSRPRKRRRRRSSSGSYLEPAELHEQTELEHNTNEHNTNLPFESPANIKTQRMDGEIRQDDASKRSLVASPILDKSAKSYERRPRKKTKEDRYDLKESNHAGKKKASKSKENRGKDNKHRKHKRKEKSGAALMDDFSAQNIAHDRLTLQPAKALGLFGRGKASWPIRRRGLPDLAFSELSFLNTRRVRLADSAKSSNAQTAEKSKQRKAIKAADTEAEISRYFTLTKALDQESSDRQQKQMQRDSHRRSQIRDFPQDFVDLPGTPFLGFGSCGTGSVSPSKRLGSPLMRDLEKQLTRSPTRSTSYLTWSQSGAPSQDSLERTKHGVLPLESSRLSNRQGESHGANPSPSTPSRLDESLTPKHRTKLSVVPERTVQTRSSSREGHSPRIGVKHSGEIKHIQHGNEETEKDRSPLRREAQRLVGDASQRVQVPDLQDLHHGNPVSHPATCMRGNSDQTSVKIMANIRPPCVESRERMNPLDLAIEALLHDARPMDHKVGIIGPAASDCEDHSIEQVGVATAGPMSDRSRTSSSGHGILQHAVPSFRFGRPPSVPEPGNDHATSYSRPDCEPLLSRIQESTYSTSRPDSRNYTPNRPPSPNDRRTDSRSAWNGYGEVYERQQLHLPTGADPQYIGDHYDGDDRGYRIHRDISPPSYAQQTEHHHDDNRNFELYEGSEILGPAKSGFDENAYLNGTWEEAEQNFPTQYEERYPAQRPADDFDTGRGDTHICDQSQHRTEPATLIRRPRISDHTVPSISRDSATNVSSVMNEDVGPSRFWTPHKLY